MYKTGDYSIDISEYTLVEESSIKYDLWTNCSIPSSQTKIENKITFAIVDNETLQFLNHSEINGLKLLPELTYETYEIFSPKNENDLYYTLNEYNFTGTVTFKNQVYYEHLSVDFESKKGTIVPLPGESKKFRFSFNKNSREIYGNIVFRHKSQTCLIGISFKTFGLSIKINHYLPLTGKIEGNIDVDSGIYSGTIQTIAKFGEYDGSISNYNFDLDSSDAGYSYSIELGDKISYNTQGTLPTQITFAFVYSETIIIHKTIDFRILMPIDIESISDANPNIEHKTNTRLTLNVRRRKADAMEDSIFKFEFVDQNVNQMSNPTIINNYKPKKVPNTDNDYTIRLIIPNNVEIGQKNLLIVIVDPSGQESSLFTIPITVTQGRIVTESSISCRKTQDMIPDGQEHLFKCNIDNIETYPVIYKAKIGRYESSFDSEFKHALRMEEVGYDNEFNVYVSIPEQTEEKTEISFAMINSNNEDIIKYCDITDIKIVPKPKIRYNNFYYKHEKYSRFSIKFKLDYTCDFETLRVQYHDANKNDEYRNVTSISQLDKDKNFYVEFLDQDIEDYEFKFIDKFGRYYIEQIGTTVKEFYFNCNLEQGNPIQGEKVIVKCRVNDEYSVVAFAEREFYFVDYSDGNKYKLLNITSAAHVDFSLDLPIVSGNVDFALHVKFVENSSITQDIIIVHRLMPPIIFDFKVFATDEKFFKVGLTASREIAYPAKMYYSVMQNSKTEELEFTQLDYDHFESFTYHDFDLRGQFKFGEEYNITIKVTYQTNKVAIRTKLFKYDTHPIILNVGRTTLKSAICNVSAGYQAILSHVSNANSVTAYAEIGNKNYTLLDNRINAIDFPEDGKLCWFGDVEITVLLFRLSIIQADDFIYLLGNQNITLGTSNNADYKLEVSKKVVVVMGSFDGKGICQSVDYDLSKVNFEIYNIYGYSNLRKALDIDQKGLLVYSVQLIDPKSNIDMTFAVKDSQDTQEVLVNSKIGNYKFASDNEDTENPDKNDPEKENPGKEDPEKENPSERNNNDGKESPSGEDNTGKDSPSSDDNSNSKDPTNKVKVGAIAGGIVGALVLIAIICIIIFLILKKRISEENESSDTQIHEDTAMENSVQV
ncbi:hypothetical protein TVAG_331240 [Trichomonas vaginalis G3]|uniref:Uncharacterized protein n=1 Tax=Trichomonas vaginalis (strain ATCC PRA-98 / G3) TaxID=412133 RepID=A2FC42_TRIV3|nr:glycoprotein 38 family [Trichomonas vaginalis G3]EAX97537.1 hypothetical protein TVAG_331240 [Trichomonas vaginalis G3]KAI5512943.1 glycoprotein 38 family [Trichomonas vaginalis G3]|eukprot:XP_001310467.1 hypothetical protein [Trichomonas vaginalis G3]